MYIAKIIPFPQTSDSISVARQRGSDDHKAGVSRKVSRQSIDTPRARLRWMHGCSAGISMQNNILPTTAAPTPSSLLWAA
jgi:hypothetical protein